MEIPTNPTPHVDYENIAGGTLETPVLVDITHGGKDESRIFHFKENEKYFQKLSQILGKFYDLEEFLQIDAAVSTAREIGQIGKMVTKTNTLLNTNTATDLDTE